MNPRVKLDELVIAANQNVKEKVYWLNQLSGDLVKTTFPYDYDGKRTQRRMEAVKFSFPANLYERLMVLSKASERKLNMVLAAGLAALLYKYIGSSDIIMGTPIYRQKTQGSFINTVLILKQHIPQQATFKNLLLDMRQTLLNAIEHRDYPVEILAKQLNFSFTDHDDFPLFDVAYLLENIHDKSYIEHINCNMIFSFLKNGEGIQGVVEYNAARYEPASIKRIIHHFSALLETILFRVDLQLSAASMLSPGEKQRILVEFNNTKTGVVRDKCFQQLFEEQVEKSPDSIATVHDRRHITYRKLNELSNQLARMLSNEGVKRDQAVGVMLERSPLMVVSILAVWKAGGAYVPIEPDFPIERIRFILDGSQSGTLLTDSHTLQTHWLTFSDLQGLGFMRDEIHETGRRGPITNFNDLPIPHRSLVNYERYNQYIGQAAVKNSITLQSTRGCPYNCAYCHKIWPKTHVIRSAENLCHEVEIFYNMGVRRFAIIDDIFNLNIKNSSRFFRLIIEKGLEVQLFFPNGLRGDLLSKEYIDLMMEAGTVSLALALETASTRLQKLVGKNLNLEILSENIEYICQEYPQVILELFTMHGFPTETREEAMMTMEFIKNYQWIHFPYVEILKIFPNTDMEKLALENGVSKEAILASENLAFHELPDTLPFDKAFTLKYQSDILSEYILKKERLLQVLPYQMALLTEDELVEKYNSYLPVDIKSFADLLEFVGIQPEELGRYNFLDESRVYVPDLNEKLHKSFPAKQADEDGLKVLLLDLSQFFSSERKMLYDVVEPPLGLMYLMTYLKEQLGSRIKGKIAKSRIDFDTYGELKELLDQFKPDVIGIRTLTFHRAFFHQSAAMIRQWGIACPIIAGGPYATSSYKELLQDHNIDLAVRGEGELTLCELIKAMLENHGDLPGEEILKRIAGIAFVPGRERQQRSYKQQVLLLDEPAQWLAQQPVKNLASTNQSSDLAYIIYTSGSTGEPKGAMVHHLGMINHLFAKINDLAIRPDDIIAQTASICFDISVWQFLSGLLVGAHPLIMDREIILDPLRFLRRLQKEKVTILETVPSLLTVFLQVVKDEKDKDLKHLRWMILTGEVLGIPLVREWFGYFPGIKLVNAYGPTEASDDVTHYFIKEMPAENRVTIPIGKPVQNTHIYIMDKHSGLCPIGVRGEICVAGIGVGKGYLKDPGKTKKSFVANPLAAEIGDKDYATMYKTGDLGCYRGDGHIEIFGRIDDQVKIKGNRIELGEIENCLLNYDGIKESLVLARESNGQKGDKYLCAYVTAGAELDKFQLRDYLSLKLPDYMIPLYFIQLEHFPLTANGKIDRKALPEPQWEASETYVAPRDPLEEKVVELWAQVLEIEKDIIGIDSNFFELGGDSLTGTILVSQIHKALNVKVPFPEIFRKPQVRLLCEYIRQLAEDRYISIVPLEKKEYYPLSSAQKRMFILQQMDLDDASYNMMHTAALQGWVDKDKLTSTFQGLIKRHESLRTSFDFIGEEPVQKIHGGDIDFKIRYAELDEITSRGTGDIMGTTMARDFLRSFDLSTAPLLRVGIVKINEDMSLIVINMHHIISDGASGFILEEDFMTLYRGHPLLPLKIQYKEYSQWQHSKKVRHSIAKQKMYWLKEFEDEIPILELPTDYPRPSVWSSEGKIIQFRFGEKESQALHEMALAENTTLFLVLFTIYNILLYRISNHEEIIIGTPVVGRMHADLEGIVGMFVNTLPLRNFPHHHQSFNGFLKEVHNRSIEGFENQEYQFEDLVDELSVSRDTGRNPIFDVMFTLQEVDGGLDEPEDEYLSALQPLVSQYEYERAKFDLTLHALASEGNLSFSFEYSTNLFKAETIERFIRYFKNAAASAIRSPEKKISEIEIMSEDEKKQVMFDFNDTQADYPSQKSIHGLFEEQAANTPGNVAVYHEDRQVTYSTLNAKANHLARLLRQQGITGDDTVGILEEYSIEIVVGLLGVLKAGSTYVPIDIQYPDTRKKFIIEDSGAKVLLIHKNFYEQYKFMSRRFPVNNFVCLDNESDDGEEYSNPEIINRPHDLAYVIYTSGTTGKPKGVMIEHQGVVNYIFWAISCYVRNEAVNFPLYTSISFDLTVTSIFTPLLSGNAVVVYSGNDKFLVEKIIDENRVDVMKLTPSHLNVIKEMKKTEIPSRIKRLILGGEELPTQLALDIYRSFKGNIQIYNEYGPTETVVGCMIYQFNPGEISGRSVSIGVPIKNMWIYILDSRQNPLPICVPGEICISGAGVARGYLKREKLTAKKFLENPFVKGKRLYRSGDLGKWRSDGNVEFLGRLDQQVKIRGFRIEPGEIETQLMNHPQVKNVVVTAKKEANSEKDLCAYIVSDRHLNVLEIREFLSGTLPDYMIPAYFYQVEDIPLTANGKVDGKKLATYESNLDPGIEYIAPTTDMEKRIAQIWKDILKLNKVGLMDNFFQIGGNSLKVILLFRRLKERLNLDFSVVLLFDHPTIGSFIKYLSENDQQESTIIGKEIERANEIDRAKERKRKQIAKRKKGAANG